MMMMHCDWYLWGYRITWFDARESVVIPFCALLERVFNQRAYLMNDYVALSQSPLYCTGYMAASRTKGEPLLPLGMKNGLGQSFNFSKPAPIDIRHSTLDRVRQVIHMRASASASAWTR
jgi:hypothetical protein